MDFQEAIRSRRSIRAYRKDPVPEAAVNRIREAVSLAPTACNRQPFKVFFVTDPERLRAITSVYRAPWLAKAPAIAVVAGDYGSCWKRLEGNPIADVDCAIVMEHITLTAADCGLGSCWICAFDRAAMDAAMNLSKPWHTVAISPVGYAAEPAGPRTGKPAAELFEVI